MLRISTAYRGISRVGLTRFEPRWNEDESSSVHRETVAFTLRVKPGLLEKQQRQQQSHVNTSEDEVQLQKRKRSFERTEFGLWFLDDRRGEDSHLQVYFETMIDCHSEEARATYWNIVLPVLRKGKCTKSTNQLEREFTCEDWSHCLYRRSFKSVDWAIFVQSEDHKRIVPPRMMNYAKNPYKSTIHQHRGLSRRSLLLLQKLDWNLYEWMFTLVQKEDTHFLYNGGCTKCLDNDASEAEVITDTKKSRIHWRPEQNAKELNVLRRQRRREFCQTESKLSLCTSLNQKNALVKVVKENEEEKCSQDNLRFERTTSGNMPKYWRPQELRRFKHASGNRE